MSSSIDSPLKAGNTADASKEWYNGLAISNDPDHMYFMDDFDRVAVDSATPNRWTVVKDASASVGIEADTVGGWATLVSQASTNNNGASLQGNEIYAVGANRLIHVEAKLKFHDADDCDFAFGLTENWATNPEDMILAANRICFQVNEADASILCKTENTNTETSSDSLVNAADDTAIVLGIRCIGTSVVQFFVNRILRSTHETDIPTANLALGIYHISGSATGTFIMEVDYIMAAMTR